MTRLVVVGAGPIGLHAALLGVHRGCDVTVLECGEVGEAIRRWEHVRLFTPFEMNSTDEGRHVVGKSGPLPPLESLLTGGEYLRQYLTPLSQSAPLQDRILTSTRLLAAGRRACGKADLIGKPDRASGPFRLLIRRPDESEDVMEADVLLDCTGFTARHRFIGRGGIPCPGEQKVLCAADYTIPAPGSLTKSVDHTVVIGSGWSAATSVCLLAEHTGRITWITRGGRDAPVIPVNDDPLTERQRLADEACRLTAGPNAAVQWMPGALIESIHRHASGYELNVELEDGRRDTIDCDRIVANPGFRADTRPFEELQIHRCYATEGPIRLAAHLLGETSADCLSQTAPGAELLQNPEPGFFILGAASYGRDSRFLLQNGLEQLDQLFESLPLLQGAAT